MRRGRRCERRRPATRTSRPSACPAPSSCRRRRVVSAETGRFDAVICLGCVIRGATPHFEYISSSVAHAIQDGVGRHRRADGVRRAHDRYLAAGRGAGRRRAGQQGVRGGGRRDRDGAALPTVASGALMNRADPAARRRAREAALQMLYQSEIGRAGRARSDRHVLARPRSGRRSRTRSRERSPTALVRGHAGACRRDRSADRGARAQLAGRADGGHRSSGAAPGHHRAADRSRRRRRRSSSTRPSSWRARSAATRPCRS